MTFEKASSGEVAHISSVPAKRESFLSSTETNYASTVPRWDTPAGTTTLLFGRAVLEKTAPMIAEQKRGIRDSLYWAHNYMLRPSPLALTEAVGYARLIDVHGSH